MTTSPTPFGASVIQVWATSLAISCLIFACIHMSKSRTKAPRQYERIFDCTQFTKREVHNHRMCTILKCDVAIIKALIDRTQTGVLGDQCSARLNANSCTLILSERLIKRCFSGESWKTHLGFPFSGFAPYRFVNQFMGRNTETFFVTRNGNSSVTSTLTNCLSTTSSTRCLNDANIQQKDLGLYKTDCSSAVAV